MIRQFFVNKVTIICAMIFIMGCSTDSITNEAGVEEVNEEKRRPTIKIDLTVEVLVEYVEGTSERGKNEVRGIYKELLSISKITLCGDEDVETWVIEAAKTPIPVADTTDQEPLPLKQMTLYANCDDYRVRG